MHLTFVAAFAFATVSLTGDNICQAADNCGWRPECWDKHLQCQHWSKECNGNLMCKPVCSALNATKASVIIPRRLQLSLAVQRNLQRHLPLPSIQQLGSHNSYISPAYQIGLEEDYTGQLLRRANLSRPEVVIANQRLSLTDQLRLGVRHLELDIHYLPPVTGNEVRLCHWDITPPQFPLLIQVMFYKLNRGRGRLRWRWSRVGCSRHSDSLSKGLREIKQWLNENPKEFVTLYLDNRVPLMRMNYTLSLLDAEFRSSWFTPSVLQSRFQSKWPSVAALVAQGYQVMVENNDNFKWRETSIAREMLFLKQEQWREFDIYQLRPFPDCQISALKSDKLGLAAIEPYSTRLLDNSNMLGPSKLFDMTKAAVPSQSIPSVQKCGINILSLDQITPDVIEKSIWTFDPSNKRNDEIDIYQGCVAINLSDGYWQQHLPCDNRDSAVKEKNYLCKSIEGNEWIAASLEPNVNASQCPTGYLFDLPRNAKENYKVRQQLLEKHPNLQQVWIKFDTWLFS